ncbi:hypothetical protein FA13DRAFT_1733507, partial [Coprinellus micaceus]
MVEIPPDVIFLFLEELSNIGKANPSAGHQLNNPTLRSCALPAQSLLFKSVVCNASFVRAVLRVNKGDLLKYVRVIDFIAPEEEDMGEFGEAVGLALDRCPRVASIGTLRIYCRGPSIRFPHELPTCFPELRSLSISLYTNLFHVPPPIPGALQAFFQYQHSLQVLEISSIPTVSISEAIQPHLANLRTLCLKRFSKIERDLVEKCAHLEELVLSLDRRSPQLQGPLPLPLTSLTIVNALNCTVPNNSVTVTYFVESIVHPTNVHGLVDLGSVCAEHDIDLVFDLHASWP